MLREAKLALKKSKRVDYYAGAGVAGMCMAGCAAPPRHVDTQEHYACCAPRGWLPNNCIAQTSPTPHRRHAVLGLEQGAGEDDIKKAYRRAALKHHPDKARPGVVPRCRASLPCSAVL